MTTLATLAKLDENQKQLEQLLQRVKLARALLELGVALNRLQIARQRATATKPMGGDTLQ